MPLTGLPPLVTGGFEKGIVLTVMLVACAGALAPPPVSSCVGWPL